MDKVTVETHGRVVENPFFVPTPKPYFVIDWERNGAEVSEATKDKLLRKAAVLWKILDMLGIDAVEAYERNYSLNDYTFDELYHLALKAERYDVTKLIRQHR